MLNHKLRIPTKRPGLTMPLGIRFRLDSSIVLENLVRFWFSYFEILFGLDSKANIQLIRVKNRKIQIFRVKYQIVSDFWIIV